MKTSYIIPEIKTLKILTSDDSMLVDWSAPDGGGGGGNEPEANENGLFEEEDIVKPRKSVWD